MNTTLTWTGERMTNAGLLYLPYRNRGEVRDETGRWIGEVLELVYGKYLARIDGIRASDEFDTAEQAQAAVEKLHQDFRA